MSRTHIPIQMLEWNETEIMEYLEVFPLIEEDNLYHEFIVQREGLSLSIMIYQYDGAVRFRLAQEASGNVLFQMWMNKCARIKKIQTEKEEYLEFVHAHGTKSNVHISVNPHVRILVT